MSNGQISKQSAIQLKEYSPPAYLIPETFLEISLEETQTQVRARLQVKKNPKLSSSELGPLTLSGVQLKLLSIKIDGEQLEPSYYQLDTEKLTLRPNKESFELEILTENNPKENSSLEGIYLSDGIFCTQCEPEGFRRITYFLDRPDVMSAYTTTLIADRSKAPLLLSNGNLIETKELANGKHQATWHDPHLKPSYLFALVAGDLDLLEDRFKTESGREIDLKLYCDKGQTGRMHHAMDSLKRSMAWDEKVFGLEYDLDLFMIVAIDAFNAGAMENKGLNIFNTSCVLADPKTATDVNFKRIEKVVAHEYFHNWTGNRVTCRDWFQLTLKEGLTVFRDQLFSEDFHSRALERIEEVLTLKSVQFPEDAGPTAHPIKPKSYIQINNFYTPTVYEKGAEIIRMIHTIVGPEKFRKGIDTYFELFDGQAITTEDFIEAISKGASIDLTHFVRWYDQVGTPTLNVAIQEDEAGYSLHLKQKLPKALEMEEQSLTFPLKLAFIGPKGERVESVEVESSNKEHEHLIVFKEESKSYRFSGVPKGAILSINRNFSAPVKVDYPLTPKQLATLMASDSDPYNRWEAAQKLMTLEMNQILTTIEEEGREPEIPEHFLLAYETLLNDSELDPAFKAHALSLPSESVLMEGQDPIDFDGNHLIREYLASRLAEAFKTDFLKLYETLRSSCTDTYNPDQIGSRSLKNFALSMLMKLDKSEPQLLAMKQYQSMSNMTDRFSALSLLCYHGSPLAEEALSDFYKTWKEDNLVMMKWFSAQASSKIMGSVDRIHKLSRDPVFNLKIPNLVRALYGAFCHNYIHFHSNDGQGYELILDVIKDLDRLNPHMAAGLTKSFKFYPRLDGMRQDLLKSFLEDLLITKGLSNYTQEIATLCLGES